DPQSEETFFQSKLHHELKANGHHRILFEFHRELLLLRRSMPALQRLSKAKMDVLSLEAERVLIIRRWNGPNEVVTILNFNEGAIELSGRVLIGNWRKRFDSADTRWMGCGSHIPDRPVIGVGSRIEVNSTSVVLLERTVED